MEKIRTIVILSEERFRKEYRHLLGKLDFARIELELSNSQNSFGDEAIEEISNIEPELFRFFALCRYPAPGTRVRLNHPDRVMRQRLLHESRGAQ